MTPLWRYAYVVSSPDCRRPAALGFQAEFGSALAEVAACGYDGVEIQVRDPDQVDARSLLRAVDGEGLRVAALGTGPAADDGLSLTDEDADVRIGAARRLVGAVELGARLGACVTLGRLRGRLEAGREESQYMWACEAIARAAGRAESGGTRLLLEPQRGPVNFLTTAQATRRLIAQIGGAGLGLVLDLHHMAGEERPFEELLPANRDLCGYVQAADTGRRPLGTGELDVAALMVTLPKMGASGWLTMEHLQEPTSRYAAETSLRTARTAAP